MVRYHQSNPGTDQHHEEVVDRVVFENRNYKPQGRTPQRRLVQQLHREPLVLVDQLGQFIGDHRSHHVQESDGDQNHQLDNPIRTDVQRAHPLLRGQDQTGVQDYYDGVGVLGVILVLHNRQIRRQCKQSQHVGQ